MNGPLRSYDLFAKFTECPGRFLVHKKERLCPATQQVLSGNYLAYLFRNGADGCFRTLACGDLPSDDVAVAIKLIQYGPLFAPLLGIGR